MSKKINKKHTHHCPQGICNSAILARFVELYRGILAHDGFGDIRLEVRILKRGQKEVIIHCGKQYRYVINFEPGKVPEDLEKFSAFIERQLVSAQGGEGSHEHNFIYPKQRDPEKPSKEVI